MAALLPTPSSDRDPGSRQRPGQQQVPTRHSKDLFLISDLDHRDGAAERKGCVRLSFSLFSPVFLDAFLPCSSFPLSLLSLAFSSLSPIPPPSLPCPCPCPILPFSLFPPFPFLSYSFPHLLISLPQHPVPSLWCVWVLAKARPGRTDGYLVRQRSPWAPTPFPPPGAAQVSRWKVRGAGKGRRSWA
uniref:Uncharacterized protein n=1 Tax=Saimiri boliviensis boliviensis TaxID=39432 RepID=A0A2K6TZP7_SAIBB